MPLFPEETICPDDYPLYYGYVYIVDGVLWRNNIDCGHIPVGIARQLLKAKEIRRCEVVARNRINKIGEKVDDLKRG